MAEIILPEFTNEQNMLEFARELAVPVDDSPIVIEMAFCRFIPPGAIVLLLARIHGWISIGRTVRLQNAMRCPSLMYLQRMDFFEQCGISLEESFERREPKSRFVTVRRIRRSAQSMIAGIATEIADCLFPEMAESSEPDQTGLYDAVEYAVSEMALNVVQHSNSDGFVHAQVYPQTNVVRIGISDFGIGILKSFEVSESPHWRQEMTDLDAISKSLEPRVSSKTHRNAGWGEPVNAGVGLTLLAGLARVTKGDFCLLSNSGYHRLGHSGTILTEEESVRGTTCTITLPRDALKNFARSLEQAKMDAGLLGNNKFSELFK